MLTIISPAKNMKIRKRDAKLHFPKKQKKSSKS